jgi:transcriptional regulator with XRE-family HTH domain
MPGERHPQSRLKDSEVREILRLRKAGKSANEVAKRFGVSESHITNISNGSRRAVRASV